MTSKHFFSSIIAVLLVAGACIPSVSLAQNLRFRIPLVISDSGAKIANGKLTFGFHPNATTCIDPGPLSGFVDRWFETDSNIVREQEGPPPPPASDFRFSYLQATCGSSPYQEDIHKSTSSTQIDTFRLNVQVDATSGDDIHSVKFRWPKVISEYADSIILTRNVGAAELRFRIVMTQLDSFDLSNYSILTYGKLISGFLLIVKNPKLPPGAPTVTTTAPPNNATGVTLTPTFSWNAVSGAKYYKFKLAKDTTFKGVNLVRSDSLSGATTSLNQVTSLLQNTTYYWRLNVANQYGYSYDQSPPLQFTTLATFPDAPVPLAPPNNATDIPASGTTLVWRTAASSLPILSYHVQIATDTNFAGGTIVVNDSSITDTTYATGALGNCVKYYWRVSAKNASGAGPYFSPKRNFRVALAAPAAPTPASPADGGTNIPVSPTLSWTGDACSDSYRLEVAWDAGFSQMVADQTLNLTQTTIGPLVDDTVYYWRVTAMNAGPFTGPASATRSFRTVLLPPPAPTLISPANDATINLPPSAFVWSSSRKATTYRFDVSKSSNFSSLMYVDSTHSDTTNVPAGLQNCQVYYWRVRAKNSSGASAFAAFRVVHAQRALPGNPLLLEPAHGAGGIGENTTLKWSPSDSCINSFILNVSTSIDGSGYPTAPFFLKETLAAKQRAIGPLTAFTKYYWRVQGLNEIGASQGDTSSFVVASTAPPAPLLVFPPNGLGGISVSPTLVWDTSARATKYRLQISYDAGFTLLAVNDSTITQPAAAQVSKPVGPLPNTTTFFWRVIASNNSGAGSPSAAYSFSTLSPPLAPTLVAPACGVADVSVLPTFFWTISDGAETYRLQVSSDSIFSLVVFDDSNLVTTTKQITTLLKSTTKYFWRVRAKNSAAPGAFSPACSFTTQRTGQANWAVPISICETGPACDTIFFGINPNATYGIDAALGEYELPQSGQFGWFDARWIDNVNPSRIGEGLRFNLHGFRNYTQVDTFRLKFQPGTGSYPMKISWRRAYVAGLGDSMVIKDEFGGTTFHARMDIDSSISITNSVVSTMLVISYGAFPLDVKPVDLPELPKGFMLTQNYPNPFNPTTRVQFSTDERADIRITVYDVLGREITGLANSTYEPGAYEVEWDGRSDQGTPMPSGIYYLRMVARTLSNENGGSAPFTMMRKMIMMK